MIIEIALAAAVSWGETQLTAESDIPQMQLRVESCSRYHEHQKIRQCLDHKMLLLQQPDLNMWDPDWISAVSPETHSEQKNTSVNTPTPRTGSPMERVAKKPHT